MFEKRLFGVDSVKIIHIIAIPIIIVGIISITGCDSDTSLSGVHSDDPGTVRIYLKSADSDKFIVIAGDTAMVGEGVNDSLALTIGQGRAYTNDNFAVLFKSLDEYRQLSETYNIIAQENGEYKQFLIFETHLPPATYDSLKIIITADYVQVGTYQISIEMPQGADPLMKFDRRFDINENRITEVRLELKPFKSMVRVGDSYHFFRDIEVVEVKYF